MLIQERASILVNGSYPYAVMIELLHLRSSMT